MVNQIVLYGKQRGASAWEEVVCLSYTSTRVDHVAEAIQMHYENRSSAPVRLNIPFVASISLEEYISVYYKIEERPLANSTNK